MWIGFIAIQLQVWTGLRLDRDPVCQCGQAFRYTVVMELLICDQGTEFIMNKVGNVYGVTGIDLMCDE